PVSELTLYCQILFEITLKFILNASDKYKVFSSGESSTPLVLPNVKSLTDCPLGLQSQRPPSPIVVLLVKFCPETYIRPVVFDKAKSFGITKVLSLQNVS